MVELENYQEASGLTVEFAVEIVERREDLGAKVRKQHRFDLSEIFGILEELGLEKTSQAYQYLFSNSAALDSEAKRKDEILLNLFKYFSESLRETSEWARENLWDLIDEHDNKDLELIDSLLLDSLEGMADLLEEMHEEERTERIPTKYKEFARICSKTNSQATIKLMNLALDEGISPTERRELYELLDKLGEKREEIGLVSDEEIIDLVSA